MGISDIFCGVISTRARDPPSDIRVSFGQQALCLLNGPYDRTISGAAAEIAIHIGDDVGFARVRLPIEQALGGHDHARGTESALEAIFVDERLLQRMKRS